MQNKTPYFKTKIKPKSCIVLDGEVVHVIDGLDSFYKHFGYTTEMAKKGILPDEYIWEAFFKNQISDCISCHQLHITEYLLNQAGPFAMKNRDKCIEWIAEHEKNLDSCDVTECIVKKGR